MDRRKEGKWKEGIKEKKERRNEWMDERRRNGDKRLKKEGMENATMNGEKKGSKIGKKEEKKEGMKERRNWKNV